MGLLAAAAFGLLALTALLSALLSLLGLLVLLFLAALAALVSLAAAFATLSHDALLCAYAPTKINGGGCIWVRFCRATKKGGQEGRPFIIEIRDG